MFICKAPACKHGSQSSKGPDSLVASREVFLKTKIKGKGLKCVDVVLIGWVFNRFPSFRLQCVRGLWLLSSFHECGQALGIGDGQRCLAYCSPWGCKELDMIEWLNWTDSMWWGPGFCKITQECAQFFTYITWGGTRGSSQRPKLLLQTKGVEQGEAYTQADPTGFYSVSLSKLTKASKKREITNMKDHWRSYGH